MAVAADYFKPTQPRSNRSGGFGVLAALVMLLSLFQHGITAAQANDAPLSDSASIPATALIMITSSHCPWCDAFEEEVGVLYDKTGESGQFPIHRLDFFTKFPPHLAHLSAASVTPTFIVIRDHQEIGRIEGYPGDEMFWWRFSEFTQD